MWNLKCGNNEKTVTSRGLLACLSIRDFFADNGWAMTNDNIECVMDMHPGEILTYQFPRHETKQIVVSCFSE